MDKLKINLIPPEVKAKAKKQARRSLVNKISILLLGVLILATTSILAVIIFQSVLLQTLTADIKREEQKIGSLRDKEAIVYFLNNRIDTIKGFGDDRYKQAQVFQLITGLLPDGVKISVMQIDKSDKVVLQGETSSTSTLADLFDGLVDPVLNEGKIASVNIDSLTRSGKGLIIFGLTINMKEKTAP